MGSFLYIYESGSCTMQYDVHGYFKGRTAGDHEIWHRTIVVLKECMKNKEDLRLHYYKFFLTSLLWQGREKLTQ